MKTPGTGTAYGLPGQVKPVDWDVDLKLLTPLWPSKINTASYNVP